MSACPPPPLPSFLLLFLAGPHLPALDWSGPRRISTASSRSQWASPDLHCQLSIAVGLAGPPLPALDRSGPRRNSTASSRSQWASPDLNRRESERCGPLRTSLGEIRSTVGLAGPQRPEKMSARMPEYMSDRMPDRMSDRMPDRMSEYMPNRLPDRMPEHMSDGMSEYMPDRIR